MEFLNTRSLVMLRWFDISLRTYRKTSCVKDIPSIAVDLNKEIQNKLRNTCLAHLL